MTGFSKLRIFCRAFPAELSLPVYFFELILNTWMPNPNVSWGGMGLFELPFCCPFMSEALKIDGRFII